MAETQRVLRMGRTKMYELVTEWRQTGGQSGLRVVELGSALRVPRVALEDLIGGPIHVIPEHDVDAGPEPAAPVFVVAATNDAPECVPHPRKRPSRRPVAVPAPQLGLFDPPEAS